MRKFTYHKPKQVELVKKFGNGNGKHQLFSIFFANIYRLLHFSIQKWILNQKNDSDGGVFTVSQISLTFIEINHIYNRKFWIFFDFSWQFLTSGELIIIEGQNFYLEFIQIQFFGLNCLWYVKFKCKWNRFRYVKQTVKFLYTFIGENWLCFFGIHLPFD